MLISVGLEIVKSTDEDKHRALLSILGQGNDAALAVLLTDQECSSCVWQEPQVYCCGLVMGILKRGLTRVKDAMFPKAQQVPSFCQIRQEESHLLCLTITALQAGGEVTLSASVVENALLCLMSGDTLGFETTRATP